LTIEFTRTQQGSYPCDIESNLRLISPRLFLAPCLNLRGLVCGNEYSKDTQH
jgi:hypothetical protein